MDVTIEQDKAARKRRERVARRRGGTSYKNRILDLAEETRKLRVCVAQLSGALGEAAVGEAVAANLCRVSPNEYSAFRASAANAAIYPWLEQTT